MRISERRKLELGLQGLNRLPAIEIEIGKYRSQGHPNWYRRQCIPPFSAPEYIFDPWFLNGKICAMIKRKIMLRSSMAA
jgi:hypothetical protein